MTRPPRCLSVAFTAVAVLVAGRVDAQSLAVRGFADVGSTAFSATESFEAVLGSRTGIVFGGGGEVLIGRDVFVNVRASRFAAAGTRVFVFDGQTFDLGIDTDVRVTPVELTGGYRFSGARRRVVPYAGGGIGWHRYEETSAFADEGENVNQTHLGYHLIGGAEFPLARWAAVAGEAQWTAVPNALGQDPNSVSALFDETDLGGVTVRVKIVIAP